MKIKFGFIADLPDARDFKYHKHPEMRTLAPLPPMVDLRPYQSPVVDQGEIGSCTANAIAGALEFLELAEMRDHSPLSQNPEEFDPNSFSAVSRLFIYWNERELEGTTNQDLGAQLRDGIKSIRSQGICRESLWPYDPGLLYQKPNTASYLEGAGHKVMTGYRLENDTSSVIELKRCLASGYPFVFGISVYESFMSGQVGKNGIVPLPDPGERVLGGHALLCVGYDDAKQVFIVKNSWSASWGDHGYCYIQFGYLGNPDLCSDLWTLRRNGLGSPISNVISSN